MTVPLITVQPDALEVITDVKTGKVKHESFWINCDETDGRVDVYSHQGQVVLNKLDNIGATSSNSRALDLEIDGQWYQVLFPETTFANYHCTKNVTTIGVSPGGELLVAGYDSGELDVLSLTEQGLVRRELDGHFVFTTSVKFFASGQVVLSGGDMTLKVWSAADGSNPRTLKGHSKPITDIAMVGRGRNVVSGSQDGTVKLWECGSGDCIYTFTVEQPVVGVEVIVTDLKAVTDQPNNEAEFETCGKSVVIATASRVYIYALDTKQLTATIDSSNTVKMTASSSTIVTGSEDGQISLFKQSSNEWSLSQTFQKQKEISALAIQQDGILAVAALDSTPLVINTKTGQIVHLQGNEDHALAVAILNNHVYVAGKANSLRRYKISD